MNIQSVILSLLLPTLSATVTASAAPASLFDGKSLDGWEIRKGEEKWWKVEDGMIVGGSLEEQVPFNTFISSSRTYGNFELSYKLRLVKGEGFMNSGMQIRSQRSEKDSEMIGYQVDAGAGFWGDLYDESRRNAALAKGSTPAAKDWEWNDYRVLCEGPRIQTWINGILVTDYTEKDASIPQTGLLGLQTHGGGKLLVQMKDISINELGSSDGSRTPEAQRASFVLPEGYTAELVASEEQGVGKPITVTWDRHGRMWTMTALEYPVDANENEAAARELYRTGGKDRVLVFDDPNNSKPQTPRVFADKLAIPLGVLPTADGVLVQHGPEIRRYQDKDGDGKADGFEVVLEGFGIQDSHLFPHQFEHMAGGWIYLAQGAFNYSKVRRPGGINFANGQQEVEFNNCKLARFRPDGSLFEPLTAGPNNIWGMTTTRTGETFIQEANDLGYPVTEMIPGTAYPSFSNSRLRDDNPVMPPSTPGVPMGGTGLSGLALAADKDTPFAKNQGEGSVFYLANPITSRIQVVTMTRDANDHPVYKKGADFMTTDDTWFRPIAIRFGPDGCLYVVDWYNKIISHNEIPRNHPDRDKSRGRIWRIRHESQQPTSPVDFAKVTEEKLPALFDHQNAFVAAQAWQEAASRKLAKLSDRVENVVTDTTRPAPERCSALWALEGQGMIDPAILSALAEDKSPALRAEVIRIAGERSLPEADFIAISNKLENERHYRVRAAIANSVRSHTSPSGAIVRAAVRLLALEPLPGDTRAGYDRNFERYLVRWAMSAHPEATRDMLKSGGLPAEARLLAARSLDAPEAAAEIVKLLPDLERPLVADELALLGSHLKQGEVAKSLPALMEIPGRREPMLRSLLQIDSSVASNPALSEIIGNSITALLSESRTPEREQLAVRLARKFGLTALAPEVGKWMTAPGATPANLAEGLATLTRLGNNAPATFGQYLDHADASVKREALIGFAGSGDPAVIIPEMEKRWDTLPGASRSLAITAMATKPTVAEALARSMSDGRFAGFDGSAVEKIIASLGTEHPAVTSLLEKQEGLLKPVLRLGDGGPGRLTTDLSLKGPFTVETWIRLERGIDQNDSLLGKRNGPDFNFAGERLRVWGGTAGGDILIASRPVEPEVWTHCAITRDAEGRFTIYLDGEPDPAKSAVFKDDYAGMNVGENFRGLDSAASYDEFRIWNVARTADEIRRDFRTTFGGGGLPDGLVFHSSGRKTGGKPEGSAKVSLSRDFPELVTVAQAAELDEKFSRVRKLAEVSGDAAAGKELARGSCLICHRVLGEGMAIGPDLSGAGAMGTEALLRNILTPNIQLESGYFRHDVKLRDGTVASGFLAGENETSIRLRQIGADERFIPKEDIITHDISRRSLMPEGLIDGFSDRQVSDLFSYLKTLR